MDKEHFLADVKTRYSNHGLPIAAVADASALNLQHIKDGVILFHSPWSGYSTMNIARVLLAIQTSQWEPKSIAICWSDGFSPEETIAAIGAGCHGYGEGVVIRSGHAVAHHYRSLDFEGFLQCIRERI